MSDSDLIPKPQSWHKLMQEMVHSISKMSKDPRTKVGAVIVSPDRTQLCVGWNGFPRDFPDYRYIWENRDQSGPSINKYDAVIHAEENAILNCHMRPKGWTLYCTHHPCAPCASRIVQAGITSIFYDLIPDTPSLHIDRAAFIFRKSSRSCIAFKDIQ